jgi:hypothetical protein
VPQEWRSHRKNGVTTATNRKGEKKTARKMARPQEKWRHHGKNGVTTGQDWPILGATGMQ